MDNEARDDTFVDSLHDRILHLLDHPGIGVPRYRFARGLRAVFHQDQVVYYKYTDDEVVIIRVAHGARDQVALLDDSRDDYP